MDQERDHELPGDLSALAWVHDELRRTLDNIHKLLRRHLRDLESREGQGGTTPVATALLQARGLYHQGVGALELIGLKEPARFLGGCEQALQRLALGGKPLDQAAITVLERASFALLDYLHRLLVSKPVPTLALFPQYKAAMTLAGAERGIHPADLWSTRIPLTDLLDDDDDGRQKLPSTAIRQKIENDLLSYLRTGDPDAGRHISQLFQSLVAGAAGRLALLWPLAGAFYEAQAAGLLSVDVYAKRISSRLLAQLREAEAGQTACPDRLLHDLLFFCARSRRDDNRAPLLAAVCKRHDITSVADVDYERSVLGRYDPALIPLARRRVANLKESWSALAAGELATLAGVSEQSALVTESVRQLYTGGEKLAGSMQYAIDQVVRQGQAPRAELAMEVATTLLCLDASLDEGDLDRPDLQQRMERLAERLDTVSQGHPPMAVEPWVEDLYREVSDRQAMGSVVQELRTTLAEVEQQLDRFNRETSNRNLLLSVPGQLASMRGVFAVLGLDHASHAIQRMRDDISALIETPEGAREVAGLVADNLGALSFLIDMLGVQPQLARSLFRYDSATGRFSAVMGQSRDKATEVVEVQVPADSGMEPPIDLSVEEIPNTAPAPLDLLELDLSLGDPEPAPVPTAAPAAASSVPTPVFVAPPPPVVVAPATPVAAPPAPAARQPAMPPAVVVPPVVAAPVAPAVAPQTQPPAPAAVVIATAATPLAPPPLSDDDAEMRDIFLEEAQEVFQQAQEALDSLGSDARDQGSMTAVRRAFHTLKGSSRMVGLRAFGEAAWACEQLYNARLADPTPGADRGLLSFTHDALSELAVWIDEIATHGYDGTHDGLPLIHRANVLRVGEAAAATLTPAPTAPALPAALPAALPSTSPTPVASPTPAAAPLTKPAEAAVRPPQPGPVPTPAARPAAELPTPSVSSAGSVISGSVPLAMLMARGTATAASLSAAPAAAPAPTPVPLPAPVPPAPTAQATEPELPEIEGLSIESVPVQTSAAEDLPQIDFDFSTLAEENPEKFVESVEFALDRALPPIAAPLSPPAAAPATPVAPTLDLDFGPASGETRSTAATKPAPDAPSLELDFDLGASLPVAIALEEDSSGPFDALPTLDELESVQQGTAPALLDTEVELAMDMAPIATYAEVSDLTVLPPAEDNTPAAVVTLAPEPAQTPPTPPEDDAHYELTDLADLDLGEVIEAAPELVATEEEAQALDLDLDLDLDFALEPPAAGSEPSVWVQGDTNDESPLPGVTAPTPPALVVTETDDEDDHYKSVGPLRIPTALFNIYLNEADEQSRRLGSLLTDWRRDLDRPVSDSAVALAHSLAGNSATVGNQGLSSLARRLEHSMGHSRARGFGQPQEAQLYCDIAEEIRGLLHQFAAGFLQPVSETLLNRLAEHEAEEAEQITHAAALDMPEDDEDFDFTLDDLLSPAVEPAPAPAPAPEPATPGEPAAQALWSAQLPEAVEPLASLEPAPHTVAADAVAAPAAATQAPTQAVSPTVAASAPQPAALAPAAAGTPEPRKATGGRGDTGGFDEGLDATDLIDPELFEIFDEEGQELLPVLAEQLRHWERDPENTTLGVVAMRALHTFKGGARLAGAMRLGELAHRLETAIEQVTSRGTTPDAAMLTHLQAGVDVLDEEFQRLRQGGTAAVVEPTPDSVTLPPQPPAAAAAAVQLAPTPAPAPVIPTVAPAPAPTPMLPEVQEVTAVAPMEASFSHEHHRHVPQPLPVATTGQPVTATAAVDWTRFMRNTPSDVAVAASHTDTSNATVRVKAQLLDRLVSQAGEVGITRARIEADVGQMQNALRELTDNLERLRRQLRDLEIQAESQMTSRIEAARSSQASFDPLEMDRFTRVQELTRMLAESVNDVGTVQRGIQQTLQDTTDQLSSQARMNRDLQDDLLRARMVEFDILSDRLYRVVRQAGKESSKQVRLNFEGGGIELDRAVLDRMAPAFEHLLRNAVVHGIETPARREAVGKPSTGTIEVRLSQLGNEVQIEVRDDGAGLNLARIAERARSVGLIKAGETVSESELAGMIFRPGFTTAEQVTELAGRGVGMDVVRTEVTAMGGRIETATTPGRGTTFRMLLPLTTAVTQVVALQSGDLVMAVPSTLVEIVKRVSLAEAEAAYQTGHLRHAGHDVPFFWMGSLLQHGLRGVVEGRTAQVVVVRSAAQHVALHVDLVLGNQEVVVKNLGPQLSRLPGLAGISVLADGSTVLIYNPVALMAVYGARIHEALAAQHRPQPQALADQAQPKQAPAAAHPQDLAMAPAEPPLVMVVDDSLTVRRVTQRLLQREGYRVLLAKDGLDALEKLTEHRPAVMLCDIEMPRMDGFDLVRNVRGDPRLADIPVVMITSRIAQKHQEHARDLGVNHYLGKPYDEDLLLSLVREYAEAASVPA